MSSSALSERPRLIVICGPTAVGKTALALALAGEYPLEVISADSRQVYRQMDIGTAKPSIEEQAALRHHMIDVVWPDEPFDAARYAQMAAAAIEDVLTRGRIPVLVGGTGLYIRVLTEGLVTVPAADQQLRDELRRCAAELGTTALHRRLAAVDPQAAATLHPNDLVRIVRALEVYQLTGQPLSDWQREHGFKEQRYRLLKIGLTLERSELYRRIDERSLSMFSGGLVEETARLLTAGYDPGLKSLQTIGYREVVRLLQGEISRETALADLQQATRRYAKRQLTWFRADSGMIWVDSLRESDNIKKLIDQFHAS